MPPASNGRRARHSNRKRQERAWRASACSTEQIYRDKGKSGIRVRAWRCLRRRSARHGLAACSLSGGFSLGLRETRWIANGRVQPMAASTAAVASIIGRERTLAFDGVGTLGGVENTSVASETQKPAKAGLRGCEACGVVYTSKVARIGHGSDLPSAHSLVNLCKVSRARCSSVICSSSFSILLAASSCTRW